MPLAGIFRGLTLRDIGVLASTCRRLRDVAATIQHHALPSAIWATQTPNDKISALAFSPDGTGLAVANDWGVSLVLGAQHGDTQLTLDRGAMLSMEDLAWHPSGAQIVTTNAGDTVDVFNAADGSIVAWDMGRVALRLQRRGQIVCL